MMDIMSGKVDFEEDEVPEEFIDINNKEEK